MERYPLTEPEDHALRALQRCTFLPGSAPKRFVNSCIAQRCYGQGWEVTTIPTFTEKQRAYLWRLIWQYRRQLSADIVLLAVRYLPSALPKEKAT